MAHGLIFVFFAAHVQNILTKKIYEIYDSGVSLYFPFDGRRYDLG
jgi:hypothetical protein